MKRIDKIRQMSSEELAKMLVEIGNCETSLCVDCPLGDSEACDDANKLAQWLEEEVQEDA